MRNRPNNRQHPRDDHSSRWEWLRNNPTPYAQQPSENEERTEEGQSPPGPPEGFPGSFGFLGWDEMSPPPPSGAQGESGMQDTRNPRSEEYRQTGKGWGPQAHPDAWLDEPLPWEMPPPRAGGSRPGADESRRNTPSWETHHPTQERLPKQRADSPVPRSEAGKSTQGRDWEDLPSLYDELEGLESPRARVRGRRPRGTRSRNRRKRR